MSVGKIKPAEGAAAVTPNDSVDLSPYPRGLWVGGLGSLKVTMRNGEEVTFENAEKLMNISVRRVWATGTTASSIVALW